jgi:hypothetical protein
LTRTLRDHGDHEASEASGFRVGLDPGDRAYVLLDIAPVRLAKGNDAPDLVVRSGHGIKARGRDQPGLIGDPVERPIQHGALMDETPTRALRARSKDLLAAGLAEQAIPSTILMAHQR